MHKSVYFLEPKSPGLHIFSAYHIPRLGTVLLATILKGMGYNTRVFIEDAATPDWKAFEDADIIGISTITSTAPRAYYFADKFRALGKTVIMGGPHPTFMPDEALEHSDFVVRGEGEDTLPELIHALEGNGALEDINGLSYSRQGGNVHNPDRSLIADLGRYPALDFSLVHGWTDRSIVPIATSRGCPFDCRFCSVISMFGRKYRFQSIDRVLDEIKSAGEKPFVFFIDDNFTADKHRTKELLKRIIDEGVKLSWGAQVRTDAAADPELLRLMKKSGCTNVYVGFESINPSTLKLYNKKQGLEDVVESIRKFRGAGIRVHGMFVFGSDTDGPDTMRDTSRFARRMGIESVQFLILTPLPGTQVYREFKEQGRLLHSDWSRYDTMHTVFMPALMTPSELQRATFKAMAGFYSWRTIIKHLARFNFYCGMLSYYGKRTVRKAYEEGERYLKEIEKPPHPV